MVKFCTKCGAENSDSSKFCKSCGSPMEVNQPLGNMNNSFPNKPKNSSFFNNLNRNKLIIAGTIGIIILIVLCCAYVMYSNTEQLGDNRFKLPNDVINSNRTSIMENGKEGYGTYIVYNTPKYEGTLELCNYTNMVSILDIDKELGLLQVVPTDGPLTVYDYSCGDYIAYEICFELDGEYYSFTSLSYNGEEYAMQGINEFYDNNPDIKNIDYAY